MVIDFIAHENISESYLEEICHLKKQHWDYPIKNQIAWINNNLKNEDVHLILKKNHGEVILGYMNLVNISVTIASDEPIKMIGIGNVCVDKKNQKKQYGFFLMKIAEYYLRSKNSNGVLFCKEKLLPFYDAIKWHRYYGTIKIKNILCDNFAYFFDELTSGAINIDRKF